MCGGEEGRVWSVCVDKGRDRVGIHEVFYTDMIKMVLSEASSERSKVMELRAKEVPVGDENEILWGLGKRILYFSSFR